MQDLGKASFNRKEDTTLLSHKKGKNILDESQKESIFDLKTPFKVKLGNKFMGDGASFRNQLPPINGKILFTLLNDSCIR